MGKLVYLLDFSRVLRSIYINMKNGLRLQDAIEISKNSVNNAYLISQIENSISNVFMSKYWVEPFEKDKVINPIILAVLKKSKNEKEMIGSMEKALEYLNVEIDEQMTRVLKLLPEISNVIVGLALILFTIVIVLPCIQVYLGGYLFI
jgi:type II secretory pathway component PulF